KLGGIIPCYDKFGLYRQLLCRQSHCFLGNIQRNPGYLEHDPTWLHDGHPVFRCTFTLTHTDLKRFLGDGLVREYLDPQLALSFHVPSCSNTRSLDLTGSNEM